jgi:protein gp37
MAENSKIEWCHHTVNFVIGCEKVSAECTNCYAEILDKRYKWGGQAHWGKNAPRYLRIGKAQEECRRLDKKAKLAGRKDRVFINSLSDTFEDRADLFDARLGLWESITECDNLIFLLLTKRPENIEWMAPRTMPKNVWLGTTVGNQSSAVTRIPYLLKNRASKHFLSCEPLLEAVDVQHWITGIDWVIVGGESGAKKRPMDLTWARSLRNQCAQSGVAFFMKQVDKVQPIPEDLMIRQFPE